MRVARAFRQDPLAVAAQPVAATAWAHLQLLDLERLEEFQRDAEDLRSANRIAMAFNDPKLLGEEHAALRRRMRMDGTEESIEAVRARGLALAARIGGSGVMLA